MADEADKLIITSSDEIMQSDPPDQGSTSKISTLISDISGISKQIDEKSAEVTAEFIKTASRDQIHIKKLELKTLYDLYDLKIDEINKEPMLKATKDSVTSNQESRKALLKSTDQMFATSKYDIASALKKVITSIYNRLKEIRESVTVEYLQSSTETALAEKRSEISTLYSDFLTKYNALDTENLTTEEGHELITQKIYAETAANNVDKFIQNELKSRSESKDKEKVDQKKPELASTNANPSEPNHTEQITQLQSQLKELMEKSNNEKVEADERIKSLETKISDVYRQNADDEIVGSSRFQSDPGGLEGESITVVNASGGIEGLKIGQITLPSFGGNLEDWESFKSLYETLIHNSSKYTKVVKFNQLRTLLKGQALDAVRGYQITGGNYDAAWGHLKKRYDRTDELIDEYIRKFFETKALEPRSNFVAIRKIIDYTNQMLRALPTLGATVNNWDPIVNLILCSKLNEELRSEWARKKARDNGKSTIDLLDYLEEKAIELQPKQSEKFSEMLNHDTRKKPQAKKVFQTNESQPEQKGKNKRECALCKGNHSIWNCNILKTESAKARSAIVKALGLCFKCLLKHRAGLCDNEDCEYCGGPHHVLLCFKKENEDKLRPIQPNSNSLTKPSTSQGANIGGNNSPKNLKN